MNIPTTVMILAIACLTLPACKTGATFQRDDALEAEKLEIQVDAKGTRNEIEYHIKPDMVPAAVHEAMNKLHPGGPFTGAEREWNDGKLYFELSRAVEGFEVEAMFTPEGQLFSEEIQVAADKVPASIRDVATRRFPGGKVTSWEEIRNGKRELVEYHVKVADQGRSYKLILSLGADLLGVYREIPAELEVPVKQ